jgi:hypothetical protein
LRRNGSCRRRRLRPGEHRTAIVAILKRRECRRAQTCSPGSVAALCGGAGPGSVQLRKYIILPWHALCRERSHFLISAGSWVVIRSDGRHRRAQQSPDADADGRSEGLLFQACSTERAANLSMMSEIAIGSFRPICSRLLALPRRLCAQAQEPLGDVGRRLIASRRA